LFYHLFGYQPTFYKVPNKVCRISASILVLVVLVYIAKISMPRPGGVAQWTSHLPKD
jgi:hypothetical protein